MERSNRVSQCVLSTAIIENRTAWAQFFFADHCSAFVHYVMRQAVRHIENIAVLTNILQFHTNHNFIDLRQNKKGFLQHVTRCVHTGPGRHTNQTDVRQYGDTDNYIAQKWSSGEIGWPHFFWPKPRETYKMHIKQFTIGRCYGRHRSQATDA